MAGPKIDPVRIKNNLKRTGIGISIGIVLLAAITILLFFNEIRSLASLKKLNKHPFYSMSYYGDYGFDESLKIGAENDQDIERFVMKRLLRGLGLNLDISSAGCTVFTAVNDLNERIFARNFDFDYTPSLLVYTEPSNGYRSISTVNLSYADYTDGYLPQRLTLSSFLTLAAPYLPFDGMNEQGVSMALLAVPFSEPPQKTDQFTLNTTTAIRLVLDKAASVDEGVALLKKI